MSSFLPYAPPPFRPDATSAQPLWLRHLVLRRRSSGTSLYARDACPSILPLRSVTIEIMLYGSQTSSNVHCHSSNSTGAYFIVACDCVKALRYRYKNGNTHWYMITTFCLLFFFITFRVAIDWKRAVASYTNPSDTGVIDLGTPASVSSRCRCVFYLKVVV